MKTFFTILFLLFAIPAYPTEYYVFIDKTSPVNNTNSGQNSLEDILDIAPLSKIKSLSKRDSARYDIIIMELTDVEAENLRSPLLTKDASELNGFPIEQSRKYQIDATTLVKADAEIKTVYNKTTIELTGRLTTKSAK